jgi:DNA-binding beta-propeller fold protein YncE
MKSTKYLIPISLVLSSHYSIAAADQPVNLQPAASIELPDSKGPFDFLQIDAKRNRLLAAHQKDGTADYFDLAKNKLIARIKLGAAVDHAVDATSTVYFVSVTDQQRVALVDAASLKELKSIKLGGPTDRIMFEPNNHLVYVTHDDGSNVWVIDPATAKVIGSVEIPGVPEYMVYDASTDRIYLNIKDANVVAVIDPNTQTTVAKWSTAPAESPHGLALDAATRRVFVAGGNGKLVAIDTSSGKVTGEAAIADKADQIAFDPARQVVYCAAPGRITLVSTSGSSIAPAGEIRTALTAKNVAVDPHTGAVWTTYTDGKSSFAKSWVPTK